MANTYDDGQTTQGLGTDSASPSTEHKTYDADPDTAAAETGGQSTAPETNSATEDEQEKLGKGYTGNNSPKSGGLLRGKAKTKAIGILVGLLVGGGAAGFIAIPSLEGLQLIHYSETLGTIKKPLISQSNTKVSRFFKSVIGATSAGDSRLSFLQYMGHDKLMTNLKANGISIGAESRFGLLRSMTLDPSKMTDLQDMTKDQLKAALEEKLGTSNFEIYGNSKATFTVTLKDLPSSGQNALIREVVASTGEGKLSQYLMARHLRAYYNVPDLLHPMRKLSSYAEEKVNSLLTIAAKRSSKIQGRIGDLNEKLKAFREAHGTGITVAGGALMLTGIACTVLDAQNDIHNLNKTNIFDPAVLAGTEATAFGDQVKYSNDNSTDSTVIDATNASMYDSNGYSPFDGNLVRELQGMGQMSGNSDAQKTYQASYNILLSAFTADSILNSAATIINNAGGSVICSSAGNSLQLVAGAALMVTGAGIGAKLVVQVAASVAGGVVLGQAMTFVTNYLSTKMPDLIIHQGALGGDLDALGVKTSTNMTSAAAGGAAMSTADLATTMKQVAADDTLEARQKSIASRFFDVNDSQSLIAKVIDKINTNPMRNLQNTTTAFSNVATSIFGLPSRLASATAYADSPSVPVSELQTVGDSIAVQNVDDANTNATYVTKNLSAQLLDSSSSYATRALTCFGTKFMMTTDTTASGSSVTYFDAKSVSAVDFGSVDYQTAHCNDDSDNNWVQIRAFLGYLQAAETTMCGVTNYTDSCTRIGYNGGATAAADTGSATTETSSGTTANSSGWAWPISGTNSSSVGNGYHVQTSRGLHKGIDLPKPAGTQVLAAHSGTVSRVINSGSCGMFVIIDTGTGLWAGYQHLAKGLKVKQGDTVTAGQTVLGTIGTVGDQSKGADVSSSCSTGAHLHFSIETADRVSVYADKGSSDTSVNPLNYLP